MPNKKTCYFGCNNYEGPLYGFPSMTYTSYERFRKWKNILTKKDREKEDYYISQNYKLCCNHFEKHFVFANKRLTRHSVPTLRHGISIQQEELLCSFVEENSTLLLGDDTYGEMLEDVIDKWKDIETQLNAIGPNKNYSAWAEYLHDVMSKLKTKQVIWAKDTSDLDTELIKNSEDFSDLELKILQLWHLAETTGEDSTGQLEINLQDENGDEYMIKVEHGDNSNDSISYDTNIPWTDTDIESGKEIVTFTLNTATGGKEPLLQAAEVAPYEEPKSSDVKCNCTNSNGDTQDEFDDFGKDIAQKLRSMPRSIALETQQLLTTVLRNRQIKILNFNNHSFLRH